MSGLRAGGQGAEAGLCEQMGARSTMHSNTTLAGWLGMRPTRQQLTCNHPCTASNSSASNSSMAAAALPVLGVCRNTRAARRQASHSSTHIGLAATERPWALTCR